MDKKTYSGEGDKNKHDEKGNFNAEVCVLKHVAVDKEVQTLKDDAERRHEELKDIISDLKESIKEDAVQVRDNLRDKIVLTEKTIGSKIDSLSEFDDTLKGNGTPGVWESIRSLRRTIKGIMFVLFIVVVLDIGGSWNSIRWSTIKEKVCKIFSTEQTSDINKGKIIDPNQYAIP